MTSFSFSYAENKNSATTLAPEAVSAISMTSSAASDTILLSDPMASSGLNPGFVTESRLLDADNETTNWLSHGRTYDEKRFSPLKQINDKNIDQLNLAWSFEMPDKRGLEGTPIVVDGVMYTVGAWSVVYAHNAKTGDLLWQYNPEVPEKILVRGCCGPVSRGVAVYKDKVYLGAFHGWLIALDRTTGKVVWKTLTIDPDKDYTITGAPRVFKGNVLIGNGGAEYGVRGYLSAYDAETGVMNWRFYTVPGNPADPLANPTPALKRAAETWTGEWWKLGGGGTVWDSMAYDPELNLVYIGVGNGSPWNHKIRSPEGGDNLYLSSMVAVNADTGEYVWHYQTTPAESWDFTATQQMVLADIEIKGKIRKVIMQAPKNGFFFIIDRVTGEYLSAEPFTTVNWATHYDDNGRPVETEDSRYLDKSMLMMPAAIGGHNWHSMSYSDDTGYVYIPVIKAMMEYKQPSMFRPNPHHPNIGVDLVINNLISPAFVELLSTKIIRGELLAWDPTTQKEVWRHVHSRSWNGGVLSTAGNLVFQGTADQKFMAFNAKTGKELWSHDTKLGMVAAPISYSVDGEQYVAVMAKWGGAFPLAAGISPIPGLENGRILVFKLGGEDILPPSDMLPVTPLEPPMMPDVTPEQIHEGLKLYTEACSTCHGLNVVSGGIVPDLRHLNERHALFNSIVLDGLFEANGMVGFRDILNEDQADLIHAFILNEAHGEYQDHLNQSKSTYKLKLWFWDHLAEFIVAATEKSTRFYVTIAIFWGIVIVLLYGLYRLARRVLKAKS